MNDPAQPSRLRRALGVEEPEWGPLPQSTDRPEPSEEQVFMARVVLVCIAAFAVGAALICAIQAVAE